MVIDRLLALDPKKPPAPAPMVEFWSLLRETTVYPRVPQILPAFDSHSPQDSAAPEQFNVYAGRPSGPYVSVAVAQAASRMVALRIGTVFTVALLRRLAVVFLFGPRDPRERFSDQLA
jgi:hypothetical protein